MIDLFAGLDQGTFIIVTVLVFVVVVLFFEGLYLAWDAYRGPGAARIARRLRALSGTPAPSPLQRRRGANEPPWLERWLLRLPRLASVDRLLAESGLDWSFSLFVGLSVGTALLGGALALTLLAPSLALLCALAAALLPLSYVLRLRQLRLRRFERQLPDALDLMSRALRAGHAFPSALQMVGEETADPLGGEFRATHDEINFGVSVPQALLGLAERVHSTDLRYFVMAVVIQRETGGNLTQMLGNLSSLIRERHNLFGRIRVLSAEGRLSGWILALLPFVLALVISVVNPSFLSVLWTDPLGHTLVGITLLMMLVGIVWMRKVIRIHV